MSDPESKYSPDQPKIVGADVIVRATHGFVDLYKIGKANYLKGITKDTDWKTYTLRMIDLCHQLGVRHYIKRDLQQFLPAGYNNHLRVPQHHG